MRTLKKILSLIPLLVLWLTLSAFLWGFVFNLITDTSRDQKITVCVDAQVPGDTELAVALEAKLGNSVRMVKVRPFTYAMFDEKTLTQADLYLVRASQAETYLDWFDPLPEEMRGDGKTLEIGGAPYGILAYDAETGRGIAAEYITYLEPGGEAESFYLVFGKQSLHLKSHEFAADDLAITAARLLLAMNGSEPR